MKALILILSFAGSQVFAATEIYQGSSAWQKPGLESTFNDLEQLGVQRSAETAALANCGAAGAQNCVIVATGNVTCSVDLNEMNTCQATATASGTK